MPKKLRKIRVSMAALLIAAFLFAGNRPSHAQQPSWTKRALFPEKSEEFSFASVSGKIYLFGGGTQPAPGGPSSR